MPDTDQQAFARVVYRVVAAIPAGYVASYGQIAMLAGHPRRARMVGRAMKYAPEELPCHRVVASDGRLVPGWAQQRQLLQAEGVGFRPGGKVDMKKYRWRP